MGIPIAFFGISQWLNDYAYRVEISLMAFGLAFVISLTIALVTVTSVAIRASMANPVDSLRQD